MTERRWDKDVGFMVSRMFKHLCYALSSQTICIEMMAKMNMTRHKYTGIDIHTCI